MAVGFRHSPGILSFKETDRSGQEHGVGAVPFEGLHSGTLSLGSIHRPGASPHCLSFVSYSSVCIQCPPTWLCWMLRGLTAREGAHLLCSAHLALDCVTSSFSQVTRDRPSVACWIPMAINCLPGGQARGYPWASTVFLVGRSGPRLFTGEGAASQPWRTVQRWAVLTSLGEKARGSPILASGKRP